ncbi:thermonuclease family protein [Variovorax sp. J22R115]|uniref:thermonuclease family protein n=1 Tax=Variovorax sp. J22R115 TaxID=3053509 RepID=UPI0025784B78|nr:thermonuclease family protein [Variovorax sp. J22R115]MDM0053917.1 thermonuclease family protein [Variovorax sp. J22R115]
MHRFLLTLVLTFPLGAFANPSTCLVVGVLDGDTVKARCEVPGGYEEIKVRLNGIDAPEKSQPFGERAKQAMSDLVYMKEARLDCFKTDRYGRSVCKVMVAPASAPNGPKTLDAGLAMVTIGMAWWYRAYAREQSPQGQGQYEFAETEARAKHLGLWRDVQPTAPWDWRRRQRSQSAPSFKVS